MRVCVCVCVCVCACVCAEWSVANLPVTARCTRSYVIMTSHAHVADTVTSSVVCWRTWHVPWTSFTAGVSCTVTWRHTASTSLDHTRWFAHARTHVRLGRNRFAKPNRNRFRIFEFYAIDLSNLKPASRNRRNLLGRWFRLRNRHVTVVIVFCLR